MGQFRSATGLGNPEAPPGRRAVASAFQPQTTHGGRRAFVQRAHTLTEWPLLVAVRSTGPVVAVIDQLKAADKTRFGARIGKLADQEMSDLSDAVACLLDLL